MILSEVLEKTGISTSQLSNILKKYNIKNNLDNPPDLNKVTLNESHYQYLDEYFEHNQFFPLSDMAIENREGFYNYLVLRQKQDSITFGLNQQWDIENIRAGKLIDTNLDFKNWSTDDLEIFNDSKHRLELLKRVFESSNLNHKLLKVLILEYELLDILNFTIDNIESFENLRNFIYNVFRNFGDLSEVKDKFKNTYIVSDDNVSALIIAMQDIKSMLLCQYINMKSFVRFVKNQNAFCGGFDNSLKIVYTQSTTSINDEELRQYYRNDLLFTVPPLFLKLDDIITRFKNTGNILICDLVTIDVNNYNREAFVDFMLKLSPDFIEELIHYDLQTKSGFFESLHLKVNDKIKLVNQFPDLIVYYV